ncbi:MAG: sulfatase, partial [Planctomycetota bacterium]
MRDKLFKPGSALAVALLGVSASCTTPADAPRRGTPGRKPNIVFIFADDHAYQAVGAYGSLINETPSIDRL